MYLGGRDAHGFAGDLHDRFSKRRHDTMDGGRADHAVAADDGRLSGLALPGAGKHRDNG
jgi:hypothetical protein